MGDAPEVEHRALPSLLTDFSLRYLSGSSGFTSPRWNNYPAGAIDETVYPTAGWALRNGFAYDSDLSVMDEGVLLAYAFSVDLGEPIESRIEPSVSGQEFGIGFPGDAEGVEYRVERLDRNYGWTEAGVTIGSPDSLGRRRASVDAEDAGMLRVIVGWHSF